LEVIRRSGNREGTFGREIVLSKLSSDIYQKEGKVLWKNNGSKKKVARNMADISKRKGGGWAQLLWYLF